MLYYVSSFKEYSSNPREERRGELLSCLLEEIVTNRQTALLLLQRQEKESLLGIITIY